MDSLNIVLNLLQKGDWAISLDLKDAYFHIPIHETHTKYLRFCVNNQCYQFRVLFFGPTPAPRIFTSVFYSGSSFTSPKYSSSSLSRRLVFDKSGLTNADFRSRENTQPPNKVTVCSKSRKIKPNSNTINNKHRAVFSLKEGIVRPTSELVSKLLSAVELILNNQNQATARDFL
ncbi:unnamed protein product [Mytilus coruscus]|uniref:Reverse transcriptase domain-containing protein n=1 Tax=Mytilus coruscus TaxID=42192 RepID=A0A6J8AES9_MYTCO|nr:unnamed protein product [Mytilus coruscus]